MITLSGSECWPDGEGVPTLRDIGTSLGRISRFAGHTVDFYPVLAHTLVAALLCESKWSVYALFHDAPEALTSDVPTPWKHPAQRELEHGLYERMCLAYGLPWPIPPEGQEAVDYVDHLCLVNEAYVIGHHSPDRLVRRDEGGLIKAGSHTDPEVMSLIEYHRDQAHARVGDHALPAFMIPAIAGPIYEDAFKSYLRKSIGAGLEGVDLERAGIAELA